MIDVPYEEIVTFTRWLADRGASADDIAYVVERPGKYLAEMKAMDSHAKDCDEPFCDITECELCHDKVPDCTLRDLVDDYYPTIRVCPVHGTLGLDDSDPCPDCDHLLSKHRKKAYGKNLYGWFCVGNSAWCGCRRVPPRGEFG